MFTNEVLKTISAIIRLPLHGFNADADPYMNFQSERGKYQFCYCFADDFRSS